jgi:hypothetical protein
MKHRACNVRGEKRHAAIAAIAAIATICNTIVAVREYSAKTVAPFFLCQPRSA